MRSCGRALLALIIALSVVGTAISAVSAAPGAAPKGRFKVNGHKLYLTCAGGGRPVVVLDAGLGSDHGIWADPARSAKRLHTRVCAYDRYGVGLSGRTSKTRTIGAAAADLHGLLLKAKLKYDDSLDAFGVHGIGGTFGALLTGVFATVGATGLIVGNAKQLMIQLIAVLAAGAYAFTVTLILAFVLDKTMGLRVEKEDEIMGLDQTQHSESGYNM